VRPTEALQFKEAGSFGFGKLVSTSSERINVFIKGVDEGLHTRLVTCHPASSSPALAHVRDVGDLLFPVEVYFVYVGKDLPCIDA
jgi:hypothetical protein